jgi:hypothetical protein
MKLNTVRFLSVLFTAVALGSALAHLFALPNKIHLPAQEYLTVQQIYRGWALLGIILGAALASTATLAALVRRDRRVFVPVLITVICIITSLVLFFTFTFPANQQTHNWTLLPDNWEKLRFQWEYSHAASAVLYLTAISTLTLSMIRDSRAR